jgi:hypothetical protein
MEIQTEPASHVQAKYSFTGTMLEACSCRTLCRCWIGEDPDGGACDAFNAYHIDGGKIGDVDVTGLTFVQVVQIPGNVLTPKSWRRVIYVDAKAAPEQRQAMLDAWQGRLGGLLADLNGLIGEEVAIHDAPIDYDLVEGAGTIRVGDKLYADMAPYKSAYGAVTTLRDSIFSTIAGAPAYISKASEHWVNIPEHGMVWNFHDRNAIQGDYHFEA